MFDRETNITRYQHNVLEFVLANQQRNLFFCQNEDDRQLDFLRKHPRLQFIPWSHCDQVRVQNRFHFSYGLPDRTKTSLPVGILGPSVNWNPFSSLCPDELHFTRRRPRWGLFS